MLSKYISKGKIVMKEVGLPALSLLGLLHRNGVLEHRVVIESLINPRFEDFDWEKAEFLLPLRSILQLELKVLSGQWDGSYPFSHEDVRKEVSDEMWPDLSATVLQSALYKGRLLLKDYESLVDTGAQTWLIGLTKSDRVLRAGINGLFQDLIENWERDMDINELVDDVENALYRHAKYPVISYTEAERYLERVETMIFLYTYRTDISRLKFESEKSMVLDMVRKSQWGTSSTPYWRLTN